MSNYQEVIRRWDKKRNDVAININGDEVDIPISMTDIQRVLDNMDNQDYIDVIIESVIQHDGSIRDQIIMLLKENS